MSEYIMQIARLRELREQFSMLDTVLSGPGILQFSQASDLNFSNEQSR